MQVYWRLTDLPELQHLPRPERKALLRRGREQAHLAQRWQTWLGGVAHFGFLLSWPALMQFIEAYAGVDALDWRWIVAQLVGAVVVALAGALLYDQVVLPAIRAGIRQEILAGCGGQRPPVCFECGYDLRGTPGPTCSECGAGIPGAGGTQGLSPERPRAGD